MPRKVTEQFTLYFISVMYDLFAILHRVGVASLHNSSNLNVNIQSPNDNKKVERSPKDQRPYNIWIFVTMLKTGYRQATLDKQNNQTVWNKARLGRRILPGLEKKYFFGLQINFMYLAILLNVFCYLPLTSVWGNIGNLALPWPSIFPQRMA